MTLEAQAQLITDIQAACRKAKDSKSPADLEAARLLMLSDDVAALPSEARDNLRWAYASAVTAVTGGGAS